MKQPKKRPINVQLSKKDSTELLTVLMNFLSEELGMRLLDTNHRVEMLQRRVTDLEKAQRKQESKWILICPHDDKLDRIEYYSTSGNVSAAIYKCKRCGRENKRFHGDLSRKEKKALRKLGARI